mgnify:CR=1 FL=1
MIAHSDKQDAAATWKKTYGHHPLTAFVDRGPGGTGEPVATLAEYVVSSQFWFESFQNWQSEFLSLAAMVILSIFLRQRGSPESKPVDAPMWDTAD